ncbi:MAG: ABC transporter permease [Planctomycetes bacterium]|nr:ABC transporter permease [Planctomycetota bacterium]
MRAYILRRLLQTVVVLVLLSFALRAIMDAMPGNIVDMMVSSRPGVKPEDVKRLRKQYGLDDSLPVAYVKWVKMLVVDRDLGFSYSYKLPVSELLGLRISATLKLMVTSFLVSLALAIPLGIYVALRQHSVADYVVNFFAFAGISVPSFWLGILIMYLFAVRLGWLPPDKMRSPGVETFGDFLRHLILPTVVLCVQSVASDVRYMRASMLEVIREDYVRTARAKGLGEGAVIWKHALRNALIPIVTLVALSIPGLVSGAIITEQIFSWPGMGQLLYKSVVNGDSPVAMVSFLLIALLTLLSNLLADILYAVVDPRIRLQ